MTLTSKAHFRRSLLAALVSLVAAAAPGISSAEISSVKVMTAARPTTLVSPPGDSRLFVVEQLTGQVKIFDAGSILPTPFLTIPPASMLIGSSRGFLGMEFDPDYANNGRFYTFSIQDEIVAEQEDPGLDPGRVVVRRYKVSAGDSNVADPVSAVDILSFDNWTYGHNAGWMGFNPKLAPTDPQYLYIATGDGGNFNDTCGPCPLLDPDPASIGWARDLTNNFHGKILRIDTNVPDAGTYTLPPDNPYILGPEDSEIWIYGLRNPTGTGFDRLTGDLLIGDIGQGNWEEVNLIPASMPGGIDLGWRLREGTQATSSGVGGAKPPAAIDPIYEYNHDAGDPSKGLAVIGGRVYRGSVVELQGKYVFGDWLGRIWAITPNPNGDLPAAYDGSNFSGFEDLTAALAPPEGFGRLQGFGEDAAGELYILENCDPSELVYSVCPKDAVDGGVYKIVSLSEIPSLQPLGVVVLISVFVMIGSVTALRSRLG